MHRRMSPQKSRVLRWAGVVVVVGLFVWYRIEDPGAVEALPAAQPAASAELQRAATRLAVLADGGASVPRQRAELRAYLADSGVPEQSIDAVLRHTRDGIALRAGRDGAQTRLGGPPVLPAGELWPTAADGDKLTFVGALDFAELPRMDPLPVEGTLALYWNREWGGKGEGKMDFVAATRAFYLEPGDRTRAPAAPARTLPIPYTPLRGAAMPIAGEPGLVREELRGRPDLDRLGKAMDELERQGLYPHHVLGAPIEVQDPVLKGMAGFFNPTLGYLSEASRKRFTPAERDAGDWVLLAQIEEQDGLTIGDGGVLYFVMLKHDLEARRFDRVIGIMDSH
jgi:Domain of unknown function (DUF1963)